MYSRYLKFNRWVLHYHTTCTSWICFTYHANHCVGICVFLSGPTDLPFPFVRTKFLDLRPRGIPLYCCPAALIVLRDNCLGWDRESRGPFFLWPNSGSSPHHLATYGSDMCVTHGVCYWWCCLWLWPELLQTFCNFCALVFVIIHYGLFLSNFAHHPLQIQSLHSNAP